MKVLICNNCKLFHVAPKEKCKCGSTTLTETHQSNIVFTESSNDFRDNCTTGYKESKYYNAGYKNAVTLKDFRNNKK